ncbi:Flp family type IVb pilin [Streptomyces sp. NPDC060022]|uniref:Flp family type IVb pilin n=1 Tax=Streptomyces sp. NPDC060022 TaxID=3347039 RepID=UPI0036BB5339
MSFHADVAGAGGVARRAMPQQLVVARWLVYVLFGATVVGGFGLLLSAAQVDALGGLLLGMLLYAAAPGVTGWLLARRAWTGGNGVRWGLIAVQAWLISGGLANLREGSLQGLTQLLLPVVILVFLCTKDSREWFRSASSEREERPPFSLPHMITWRRDRGQSAVEYTGLIVMVVAIIIALILSGVGGEMSARLKEAICSVVGQSCPADNGGGDTTQAGDETGDGTDGSTDGGVTGGDTGGSTGGTGGSTGGTGGSTGGTGGSTGGTEGTTGGTGGTEGTTGGQNGPGDGPPGSEDDEGGDPTDPYEPIGDDGASQDGDDGGDGGDGDKKKECSGFWGCTLDQLGQVGEGLVVDGLWGDVTDTWDTIIHPIDSVTGLWDYGKTLDDPWNEGTQEAGDKWDRGDYWDALTDWGGSGVDVVLKPLDDMFIGDDVRDSWNRGEETQAVSNVIWNVGSLFIPGYGEVKAAAKLGKLGRLGKIAGAVTEAVDKAKDAAGRARKAVGAGDTKGARDAADDAQEVADEAKKKVEEAGECKLAALGGARLVPYGGGVPRPLGGPGSGTVVLAAAPAAVPVGFVAEDGPEPCKGGEADDAREAQEQADEADRVADGAELGDVAAKAKQTILDARDKSKTPKADRLNLNEKGIDNLVAKAKDDPDYSKGEYSKEELAAALKDLDDMLKDPSIDTQTRGSLASEVLKAGDRHKLAESMAEVRAARRAASEAAEGTKVFGAVGGKKGRQTVDMGDGTTVDVSAVDDVDVLYKGKDGNIHAVEVKNTANAATKYTVPAQAKRLADWAKQDGASPPRAARYEIEQKKDWHKIFDGYQTDKKNNVTPGGTPAQTFAENGLDVRIAGQDFTPQQIKAMDDAWNAKSDADKQAALGSGKMNDPKSAMDYLGVS